MPPSSSPDTGAISSANSDFDRVAWYYDALSAAVFGPVLRRAQQAALAGLPAGAPRVLILGGGSGWVLGEVLRRRPAARVVYLEASAAMLGRARALLARDFPAGQAQVDFRLGTELQLQPADSFDAVLTFFVLDCIAPAALGPALQRLRAALYPGGQWLLAEFSPPRRWWQRGLLGAMYAFFRLTARLQVRQLPDYPGALRAQGLQPRPATYFLGGAVLAQTWQPDPAAAG